MYFINKMVIESIFPPYIFSIRYDEKAESEYDCLFNLWNDSEYVIQFLYANRDFLLSDVWARINTPEAAAKQVYQEAVELENLFEELAENSADKKKPDFDSLFRFLEGKYRYELEVPPMKSYGTQRPSLLRIYAIKLGQNCYLITGGGIKLADTIQNSPGLKDHVIQNIDKVRDFLFRNGISDSQDI